MNKCFWILSSILLHLPIDSSSSFELLDLMYTLQQTRMECVVWKNKNKKLETLVLYLILIYSYLSPYFIS